VKNKQLPDAMQILDLINTVQDATIQMHYACLNGDCESFESLSEDIKLAFQSFMPSIQVNSRIQTLYLACESIADSLERIIILHTANPLKCAQKIEFELLPLLRTFYSNFYFYEIASFDDGLLQQYMEYDRFLLGANTYIADAEEAGSYKYELSIVIIGYNKLDYTKKCVESLLKYIPEGLSYELILLNHGSTDGTKEFFEGVAPDKQLDIFRNGGGIEAVSKIIEGKYFLIISNDVLVTENAVENLLACVKSDPLIAYVVPTTSNVSNYQSIETNAVTSEDMYLFAAQNNKLNPLRWEQRCRLCNPICIFPSNLILSSKGIVPDTYKMSEDEFLFPDDKLSFLVRKCGLKLILANDSYCYHFGSVTLKEQGHGTDDYLLNGRITFKKAFGIDPWGKGFCHDPALFKGLNITKRNNAKILGVSPGMGSNPLKAKAMLREQGSINIKIFLATDEENLQVDYETYTEPDFIEIVPVSEFTSVFREEMFDYIFVETAIGHDDIDTFIKRLLPDGKLSIWYSDPEASEIPINKATPEIIPTRLYQSGVWHIYRAIK
jgi:GT2 family glycosyltransferase